MAKKKCDRHPLRVAYGIEDKAAIYAIWSFAGLCLYVGQTKRLKTRLREHMRRSHNKQLQRWIDALGSSDTHFCYRIVEDESTLCRMEAKYIQILNPLTNFPKENN